MSDTLFAPVGNVSPKVSVIVVTYRSSHELPGCLESIFRQTAPVEVFVVDNASPDHTPQLVADYGQRYPNVVPILNAFNMGLAAANNCPLGKCRGKYVLIFNPDTILPDGSLARMVSFLDEHEDIGVLGPQNLYEDGTRHVSFHHHWGLVDVLLWRILPYSIPRRVYDRYSSYRFQDVLFVSGSCLLIRRSIYEQIGGYDPEYFLTVEDALDLCIRAKNTGCRVVFFPGAEVVHFTGRSGAQAPYIVVWEGNRGSVYHFLKHKGVVYALIVSLFLMSAAGLRVVLTGLLSIIRQRYRYSFLIHARVFWSLIVMNPIWKRSRVTR
jgi:GT2 family glycosyltransferase